MEEVIIQKEDEVVMKLLHFFITEQGYSPIILKGAQNEIWLENMDAEYKIVRLVTNYIHNDEQLDFDIFKTKKIISKIKHKTFSLKAKTLSIFLNLGNSVNFDNYIHIDNIDSVNIKKLSDLKKYKFVIETYPTISKKTSFKEKGMDLFVKLTSEISKKSEQREKEAEDIFTLKKPIITYILIVINIIMFLLTNIVGNGSTDIKTLSFFGACYSEYIFKGEYFRLITSSFLHANLIHLFCNMYVLYIVGRQMESYLGKMKFLFVYLFSAITGNLLSIYFAPDIVSVGASGAIFGIFGSLLYFGYHYRVFLSTVLKSEIIPIIIFNLLIGMMLPGIDSAAHIGGLVGGIVSTKAVGIKYKSTKSDKINGWILLIMYFSFLILIRFIK